LQIKDLELQQGKEQVQMPPVVAREGLGRVHLIGQH
jgi:hypothetical protein